MLYIACQGDSTNDATKVVMSHEHSTSVDSKDNHSECQKYHHEADDSSVASNRNVVEEQDNEIEVDIMDEEERLIADSLHDEEDDHDDEDDVYEVEDNFSDEEQEKETNTASAMYSSAGNAAAMASCAVVREPSNFMVCSLLLHYMHFVEVILSHGRSHLTVVYKYFSFSLV